MTPRTWSAAGYLVSYVAGYHMCCSPTNAAPKAPPVSHAERDGWRDESSARVVARRRRVPPTGGKTGVAGEGGATPVDRGRSPLPCTSMRAVFAARQ